MRKKGFTLIELIIVIAIIGILAGVLIPSWGYYMRRARTRSQNLKAKTVFNAAQTVVTDMKFAERRYMNDFLEAQSAGDATKMAEAAKKIYGDFATTDSGAIVANSANEWCFYWNGSQGMRLNTDDYTAYAVPYSFTKKLPTVASSNARKTNIRYISWDEKIADSINQIINEDELVYKIYVKDYKVMSVVTARSENDRYLGTYPITLDELEESSSYDIDAIRADRIVPAEMTWFDLDSTNDVTTT